MVGGSITTGACTAHTEETWKAWEEANATTEAPTTPDDDNGDESGGGATQAPAETQAPEAD